MNVAAYQAPLLAPASIAALPLIVEKIKKSDRDGVDIFCCPEGILGGLADHTSKRLESAINVGRGDLDRMLVPLATILLRRS